MEASKKEWVNPQNYHGEGRMLCNHLIASMVFGVDLLFFGGLHIIEEYFKKYCNPFQINEFFVSLMIFLNNSNIKIHKYICPLKALVTFANLKIWIIFQIANGRKFKLDMKIKSNLFLIFICIISCKVRVYIVRINTSLLYNFAFSLLNI